jgi:hypothetical protein
MKLLRKCLIPSLAATGALILSACIDNEQKLVLNPDGSGKAQVAIKVVGGGLNFGDEKPDPKQVARETAAGLIGGAQGVDAWTKVKVDVDKEGRSVFSGVAYFSDITKFSVGGMDGGGMKMGGGESSWKMEREGDVITLTFLPMGGGEEDAEPGDPPADIEAAIQAERMEFRQGKAMMAGFLSEMKTMVALKLPGEIESVKAFEKKGADVAAMSFTGAQILEGMEKVMNDDELMKKLAKEGRLGDDSDAPPELMQKTFGADAFEVRFKAGKAQFDYAAEVAEAKANPTDELKALLELAKEDEGGFSLDSEDEDEPAGDPDPAFEAFAKAHVGSLSPTLETKDGKTVQAKVRSVGESKNDGKEGEVEIKATFSFGDDSEDCEVTVYFGKNDGEWEASGFSSGGLPDFLGGGLDGVRAVSKWAKKE